MAVAQAIPITHHPSADGSYKKMLIDGEWVDAASGKKFETLNPATGEVLSGPRIEVDAHAQGSDLPPDYCIEDLPFRLMPSH
jgi:hypothetical protein